MESAYIQFGEWGGPYQTVKADAVRMSPLWWQLRGLSYTATGYGKRIPTRWMIQYAGKWRRVYCTIYSNIGTCWITINGKRCVISGA